MKQIRIGLCDDEPLVLQQLRRLIEECLILMKQDYEIWIFESGMELLRKVSELEAVFLDIEMPDLDGIETGRKIHNINPECKIIIATVVIERFKEPYRIGALRFITKPFELSEIEEALQAIITYFKGNDEIVLYHARVKYIFSQKNIKFIQAYDGYAEFIVNEEKILFRKDNSLDELEKELDNDIFFRIHKKYIINIIWLSEYHRKAGYIKIDDKVIQVAQRRKANFDKVFIKYVAHLK